ncbi:hypothetical protein TSOC_014233, partial [Tetrabaena socialis]
QGGLPCVAQLSAAPTTAPADPGAASAAVVSGAGPSPSTAPDPAPAAPPPDLGAKMLAAMADARQRGGHRKVLITGTDIPDISSQLFRAAADALDEHQALAPLLAPATHRW